MESSPDRGKPSPPNEPQPAAGQRIATRGRPWVKGQSGNPAGRPSRARQAAVVAEALIGRKTVPLTNVAINIALGGDRTALRLCLERIVPPRREPPISLELPPLANRADLRSAMVAVAEAAASGAIGSAQSNTLVRMLYEVYCPL